VPRLTCTLRAKLISRKPFSCSANVFDAPSILCRGRAASPRRAAFRRRRPAACARRCGRRRRRLGGGGGAACNGAGFGVAASGLRPRRAAHLNRRDLGRRSARSSASRSAAVAAAAERVAERPARRAQARLRHRRLHLRFDFAHELVGAGELQVLEREPSLRRWR
jgi:hypothetical protein